MKPEPLRGKIKWNVSPENLKYIFGIKSDESVTYMLKRDVKCAVEWALLEIMDKTKVRRTCSYPGGTWIKPNTVKKILIKAFSDVME